MAFFLRLVKEVEQRFGVLIQPDQGILVFRRRPAVVPLCLHHDGRLGIWVGQPWALRPVRPEAHQAFDPHYPKMAPGDLQFVGPVLIEPVSCGGVDRAVRRSQIELLGSRDPQVQCQEVAGALRCGRGSAVHRLPVPVDAFRRYEGRRQQHSTRMGA